MSLLAIAIGKHQLISDEGSVFGEISSGTGEPGDVIRWQPAGKKKTASLTDVDAKIVLSSNTATAKNDKNMGLDKLYFTNKDTVPCRVLSVG